MPTGKITWKCPNCGCNIIPDETGRCAWCLAKAQPASEQRASWQNRATENLWFDLASRRNIYGKGDYGNGSPGAAAN